LKIDLHVHSRLSKNFEFDNKVIGKLKALGMRRGLNAFALTEHIHAVDYWGMVEELRATYPYNGQYFDLRDGFRMFSGCEVTVGERVDFIVVGHYDLIERLDRSFSPRLSESHFPPALEFLRKARALDLIVISAHPFRPGKETAKLPLDEVFSLVHAVEVNGRDHGTEYRVASLANEYGLPITGSSDAHYYLQVGIRSTVIQTHELTHETIRHAFATRSTRAHCKPYAAKVVALCKEMKQLARRRRGEQPEAAIVAA
jgi:predicted metal-dependent phosphoesterase TrpH